MNEGTDNNSVYLKHYRFSQNTLEEFIDYLKLQGKVIAPHRKGKSSYIYKEVEKSEDVVLDYDRTIQPLKKYFIPPRETLLTFNTKENSYNKVENENETKYFFGIHSYEMQGIKRLDFSFLKGKAEANYLQRREQSVFIGISYKPDRYHFSKSVGIAIEDMEGFSLYIEPVEDDYLIFIVDYIGLKLLSEFKSDELPVIDPYEFEEKTFSSKIQYHYNRLPEIFEKTYHSKVWDEVAKKCLGCGTCNLLCSSCYCFEVQDEVELDVENGARVRSWDGCMLNHFAEVAGGENFRESLQQRTRHRLNRKFQYITKSYNKPFCVGCGRCSKFCPAGINITDIINDLIKDVSEKRYKQMKNVIISI